MSDFSIRISVMKEAPYGFGDASFLSQNQRWSLIVDGNFYSPESVNYTDLLADIERNGIFQTLQNHTGAYALALWDNEKKELTIARSQTGEKPLYYAAFGGSFYAASDFGAIRCLKGFPDDIDRDALLIFLEHGYFPAPYTVCKSVRKLKPGSMLVVRWPNIESPIPALFWDDVAEYENARENLFAGSFDEAVEETDRLLRQSLKRHMPHHGLYGAFLSGGIDSSLIAAYLRELSSSVIPTFSIGFSEEKFNEAGYAKAIAEHLGTCHNELYINERDAAELIPQLPGIYGEPFGDPSQIPTYLASKLISSQVPVAFAGDAGDELFAGYDTYRHLPKLYRHICRIPPLLRRPVGVVLNTPLFAPMNAALGHNRMRRFGSALLESDTFEDMARTARKRLPNELENAFVISAKDISANIFGAVLSSTSCNALDRLMFQDFGVYLRSNGCVKVGRAANATHLDVRAPLLDIDIIRFAWRLPNSHKLDDGVSKRPLRKLLYNRVPEALLDRPKKGFGIPLSPWLRNGLREWAGDMMNAGVIRNQGFLNPDIVSALWQEFINGDSRYENVIWNILMFQSWLATGPHRSQPMK